MIRISAIASLAALAILVPYMGAQQTRRDHAADSVAQVGREGGRDAAGERGVGGFAALGAATGLIAGALGIPLLAGENTLYGVIAFVPVVWAVAAADASRPAPPPAVLQRIERQPAAYQEAFRAGYAERLAQRRRRATLIGAVAGTATGLAAVVAVVIAVVSSLE